MALALVAGLAAAGVGGRAHAQDAAQAPANAAPPAPNSQAENQNAPAEAQENAGAPTKPNATPPANPQAAGTRLQEVVVTAQFRAENLQKTPLAITAVNAAQLENRSYTTILDVAQSAPNVAMTEGGGGYGTTNFAFIRGIGQPDFSFAFEPRVGFYIDDVYYATTFGSIFDLLDVDRVEIERGPQGVLNGRNSVGGAIRIFSQKPRGDGSGYIEATGGDYDRVDVKGAYDLSLVPEHVFLRLSAGEQRRDGYIQRENFACLYPNLAGALPNNNLNSGHGCKDGTLGGIDRYELKAQLRFIVNDKIEDNVTADFSDDRSEASPDTLLADSDHYVPGLPGSYVANPAGPGAIPIPPSTPNALGLYLANQGKSYGLTDSPALLNALVPGPYQNYAYFANPGLSNKAFQITVPPVSYDKPYGFSNVLDIDLPHNIHFKSITAYRAYTGEFGSSQIDIALPVGDVYNEVSHHQISQEGRFLGDLFGGRVEWTLGAFYLSTYSLNRGVVDDEGFALYTTGIPAFGIPPGEFPDPFFKTIDDTATLTNVSGYGNVVIHLTDKLILTGGVRYTHESKDFSYNDVTTGTPFVFTAPTTTTSRADPRVALQYQVTPRTLAYASYSTGFTGGGFNPRPFAPADLKIPLLTESVKAYEVGVKNELFEHRLRLNLAGYYTDYDNIQLTLSGCPQGPPACPTTSPFYYGNGGNARIYGFEGEIEAQPMPGMLVNASTGYTNFKYTSLSPAANTDNDPTGLSLNSHEPYAPEWTANIGAQYEIGLGDYGVLTPRIDWSYRSTIYYGTDNSDPYSQQPSYSLVNLRLTYRPPTAKWSAAFFMTNATDKLYYTGKFDFLNSFGGATGTVGAPREYGATVRYAW